MALELYASSALEKLCNRLVTDLDRDRGGVFEPRWIITQTDGMDGWLREQLALSRGLSLNDCFMRTNDVLVELYRLLCPTQPRALERDILVWVVFSALSDTEFQTQHPAIAGYYKDSETKRMSLAMEMADQFDQYQIYRSKTVSEWNKATDGTDWQAALWCRVQARIGHTYADRTCMARDVLTALQTENAQNEVRQKFRAMNFFGLAIVTPFYLELFYLLSNIITVRFYLLNPAPGEYWMDEPVNRKMAAWRRDEIHQKEGAIATVNSLLQSWGRILRESFDLLTQHDEYVNRYESLDEETTESDASGRTLLLHRIQNEIRRNTPDLRRTTFEVAPQSDESLQFVGCYTPAREVEVLYNRLLQAFAKDPSLGARDVVVMTPDIDLYAPFIRAVFDSGPVQIPYSIADESIDRGNTLFTDIRGILSIDPETFKAEEVMSLLDSPRIRARFGIQDMKEVRRAVREAAIYFGKDSETPAHAGALLEDTECWMVGWDYGLEKMIYGLCMSGGAEFELDGRVILPLDTAEGATMADRIRLAHFVRTLQKVVAARSQNRNLSEWATYLNECVRELVLSEEDDDDDYRRFLNLQDKLLRLDGWAEGEKIAFATFRQVFLVRLSQEQRSRLYTDKGICFCSMVPMRSVPFRFIALLGMDFDRFPRQENNVSFSLIGGNRHQAGDRNPRENDKHLFLETLMAARDTFYISFLARDAQRGSELPPSSLVDELLSYISTKCPDPNAYRRTAVCIHPLHVFSRAYNSPDSVLPPNYLTRMWCTQSDRPTTEGAPQESAQPTELLNLERLCNFFQHPVRDYFNKQQGIYFRDEEERLPEHEWFELDNLQKYIIKAELLLTNPSGKPDLVAWTERRKRTGQMPLAHVGSALAECMLDEVRPIIDERDQKLSGLSLNTRTIDYKVDENRRIEGEIQLYGNNIVLLVPSKSILKRAMSEWVRFLVALAQGNPDGSFYNLMLIYPVKEKEMARTTHILGDQELTEFARTHLPLLLDYFEVGQRIPLPFYLPLADYKRNNPGKFNPENLERTYEEEKGLEHPKLPIADDGYWECIVEGPNGEAVLFTDEGVDELKKLIEDLSSEFFRRWELVHPPKEPKASNATKAPKMDKKAKK